MLLSDDGRVLLFRYAWRNRDRDENRGRPHWVAPGGGMRPGESYRVTARRELELPEPTDELTAELLVHNAEWLRDVRDLL